MGMGEATESGDEDHLEEEPEGGDRDRARGDDAADELIHPGDGGGDAGTMKNCLSSQLLRMGAACTTAI